MTDMPENQLTIFDILEPPTPSKRILVEEDFDLAKRNPRFVYWLLAEGMQVGDEWKVYEFQIWVTSRVGEFKKMNGYDVWTSYRSIPDFHKRLDAYMQKGLNLNE